MKGDRKRTRIVPGRRAGQTGTWLDLTIEDRDGKPLFVSDVSDAPADASFEDCLGLCLTRAVHKQVSLAKANLVGVRNIGDLFFEIDISDADFTDAVLSHTEFVGCRFDGAMLRRTVIADGDIKACSFTAASLLGCDLARTVFQFCTFTDACLWSSRLNEVLFSVCQFENAHILCDDPAELFINCRFQNTWINGAPVQDGNA